MNLFLVAISLGFLGSFHCVGMCGPIALALPINHNSTFKRIFGIVSYNLGRIFTYTLLGGFFGLVGQSLVIAGYQQVLSICLGVLILVGIFLPAKIYNKFKLTSLLFAYVGIVKQKLGSLFKKRNLSSLFVIGLLNGLLPCGLVYLGIAGAIASGGIFNGSLFMSFFGMGTIPAMFILSIIGNSISVNFRNKIQKAVPVFIIITALMLILRGSNLGIPYLSPEMSANKPECSKCCHK